MKIAGAFSFKNGVMICSIGKYVAAKYNSDELIVEHGDIGISPVHRMLSRIPFIAGIVGYIIRILYGPLKHISYISPGSSTRLGRVTKIIIDLGGTMLIGIVSILVGYPVVYIFGVSSGTFLYSLILLVPMTCFLMWTFLSLINHNNDEKGHFHGAEHKVLNAFDAGLELTDENIENQSKLHGRCGYNAYINTIILYPFIISTLYVLVGSLLLALVMGVFVCIATDVEVVRLTSIAGGDRRISKVVNYFGLLVQKRNIHEPTSYHINAARVALKKLIEISNGEINEY